MSVELLHILGKRDNYFRFIKYIKTDVLPKEVTTVIKDLEDYYKVIEKDIDWGEFSSWFCIAKHSSFKPETLETYQNIFTKLEEYEDTPVAEKIVEKLIMQDCAANIAEVALICAEGGEFDFEDVVDKISQMQQEIGLVNELDDYVVDTDLEAIVKELEFGGLKWRMKFLNKAIGDLLKERLICVAARPNVGKTTFLATEASNFAAQLPNEKCVLWLNNEESGQAVFFRIVQAALQEEEGVIKASPAEALKEYSKLVGRKDKIVVINKADLTTTEIEDYCKRYNPGVIIIDQLWKVHGYEKTSGTDTARLGAIFRWGRELAKKYAPVITVHQLKTEANFVEYPSMDMLYLSGTVIQGEVDTMIMIGSNNNPGQEDFRYVSITKQKMASGSDVDPKLREGKEIVTIDRHKAMFVES